MFPCDHSATSIVKSRIGYEQVDCMHCHQKLNYPQNSVWIRCPKCANTMNPQNPTLNYVHCQDCNQLLSYPASATTIKCPKCQNIIRFPKRFENKVILFTGYPGCGKGTQAKRFKKTFGLEHFSTGEFFRREVWDLFGKKKRMTNDNGIHFVGGIEIGIGAENETLHGSRKNPSKGIGV